MNTHHGYFELGKIIRAKGIRGELQILLDTDQPQHYKNMESVWLEVDQQLVPFFIVSCHLLNNIATFQTENIHTLDDALQLVGKSVFLPLDKLPVLPPKRFYFHQLSGARVIDKTHGDIGVISQIFDIVSQPVAEIKKEKGEILFPLREVFIDRFDSDTRSLYVDLPDGLLDIYLGKGE